jgi:hypothetical protein
MLMAYCAHDLRACPSERVREDGCIGVEQAGDGADEPDRTSGVAVAKMRRSQFGPKSEKAPLSTDQLLLGLSASVIEAQPPVKTEQVQETNDRPRYS